MAEQRRRRKRSARVYEAIKLFLRGGGLRDEAIAYASDRQEVFGLGGLVFYVAAQADDEIVYGSGVSIFAQAPYFFEHGLAREDAASVPDQIAQQLRLHQGQAHDASAGANLKRPEIDSLTVEGEHVLRWIRRRFVRGGGRPR